ncbi:MAG: 1,3-beta-galactosyl-N-acetylhexosamine phosphorylase [Bifidobacteriaceae bacterium]|nr:1,3-beta-galactosyl-N-acetylhexosamine phosphorylase [Bifidobacteriaceae bacterium]
MTVASVGSVPRTGRVTLPTEIGAEAACRDLLVRLGADAVRNSDGTEVPPEFRYLGLKVYGKCFVNRGDNTWAEAHPEEWTQLYLMSRPVTARGPQAALSLLAGYFTEQVQVDVLHDPKTWWEVIDRTTGETVPPEAWTVEVAATGDSPVTASDVTVHLTQATRYHEYTVSFLVFDIWDPVQMYNHLTNGWGDKAHEKSYDVIHPATRAHALEALRAWLDANPETTVVRFTTFFYQFSLVFNEVAKEKYVDWFGYATTVSPAALEQFEREYGYRLRPEDFVDQGYYNTYFRSPTPRWRDWLEFVRRFVAATAQELVAEVHRQGREAMMFLGDQWIGTEPYGPDFAQIGLDAVVGSVGNGATMRMIADIPGVKYTEGRLLPYFVPDVFGPGGDPVGEAISSWILARRAMLRQPVDRIGYGGYPSLAVQFPEFVDVAARVAQEFRELHAHRVTPPQTLPKKVALLNAWGRLRTWMPFMVAHALPYRFTEPYVGVIEALAGLPVDVAWLSFDDLEREGVPADVGVIISAGPAGTAFSGGQAWASQRLVTALRAWVDRGGCLIGIGEPSALVKGGRTFQLADVLGVDQEVGFSLSTDRYPVLAEGHWVAQDLPAGWQVPDGARGVYAIEAGAHVVRQQDGYVQLAVNTYGAGKAAYVAGLPYSAVNSRLLHRLLLWGTGQGDGKPPYLPSNPAVELAVFPEQGLVAAVNNSTAPVTTNFTTVRGGEAAVELGPWEIKWLGV